MFAVIRTGGKQYRVQPGTVLETEKLVGEPKSTIEFSDVLLTSDGKDVKIGNPLVKGATVVAEVAAQKKGPKLIAFKKMRRHGFQKKTGHRQQLTRCVIKEIRADGASAKSSKPKAAE